ncbi:lysophospholipid acyltransferase 2b isoform X1 [Alosa alosa]|uniref:lysophospholipid acyltransferase 2b isoform X1 n=1 Tax=Alosa alosa TaxID=278164 RepID=UPI002015322C|nr:lysophospholipid acyltransferase 2b isoform X1 [Alosa alosa]
MATETISACTGSSLLQPISEIIDLPLDQVNFVVCQLFALLTAFWFRLYLHPSKTSPFIRHVVATLLGLYFALFCFGWYALHFLVQSGITYGIMILAGVEHIHKYCLVVALGYLSFCQITRVYVFDYGMYSADFTGPMMVITQKITSLAFEIHDGMARKEEQLTPNQKVLAIRRMPSLLEYFSYSCNFMGILAGPTCSYNDYIAFIEGVPCRHRPLESSRQTNHEKGRPTEPSPNMVVARKLATSFLSLLVFLSVCKVCPVERNIDDHFIANTPFYAQVVYLYLSMLTTRPKYYFVWTLADAINNAAGFGFNGYDSDGSARWDLISNLRILNIELATSFKMFLDNWNIQTAHWLKRVCYERCPYNPTAATFLLSAMWHGAYPGYYLTFLTGIVVTLAARAVRHNIRPHFLRSPSHKLVYDIITWAGTQIAICYTVVPFVLLSVGPSLKFYRSWYFSVHIACVLIALALPVKPRHLRMKEQQRAGGQTSPQQYGISSSQDNHQYHHHHHHHHHHNNHHQQHQDPPQATYSNCIQKDKTS